MSRFDYTSLVADVKETITLFGAPAVAKIPGSSQSATNQAWRGEDCGGAVDVTIELVVTEFEADEIDGDRIRRGDKQGWCFPPDTGEDLSLVQKIEQDGVLWGIGDILVVKPAGTVLAYRFALRL